MHPSKLIINWINIILRGITNVYTIWIVVHVHIVCILRIVGVKWNFIRYIESKIYVITIINTISINCSIIIYIIDRRGAKIIQQVQTIPMFSFCFSEVKIFIFNIITSRCKEIKIIICLFITVISTIISTIILILICTENIYIFFNLISPKNIYIFYLLLCYRFSIILASPVNIFPKVIWLIIPLFLNICTFKGLFWVKSTTDST